MLRGHAKNHQTQYRTSLGLFSVGENNHTQGDVMNKHEAIVAASIAAAFMAIGVILGVAYTDMEHRKLLINYGVAEYNAFNADFEILDGRCIDRVRYDVGGSTYTEVPTTED
tara:strand:- start:1025 stop:1360 length:336 start_codon:yes stop_codon:yes gene_type:complete